MISRIFDYKSPDFNKLSAFGFSQTGNYSTRILDGQFEMRVQISSDGRVDTQVIDLSTNEPYTLHLVAEADGAFVGTKRKLGLNSDEITEIIDLRIDPEILPSIIYGKKYFAGYHMNKKHWVTMCLDSSIPLEEIFDWIDKSYLLAE